MTQSRRVGLARKRGITADDPLKGRTQPELLEQPFGRNLRFVREHRETIPGAVATVDVSQLPVDIQRIERNFRRSEIRSERDGLNLRYFVEVFAKAPAIVLFTPEDNLRYGPVPYGAPTHSEMVNMITPRYHQNHGGIDLLNPRSSIKNKK